MKLTTLSIYGYQVQSIHARCLIPYVRARGSCTRRACDLARDYRRRSREWNDSIILLLARARNV